MKLSPRRNRIRKNLLIRASPGDEKESNRPSQRGRRKAISTTYRYFYRYFYRNYYKTRYVSTALRGVESSRNLPPRSQLSPVRPGEDVADGVRLEDRRRRLGESCAGGAPEESVGNALDLRGEGKAHTRGRG